MKRREKKLGLSKETVQQMVEGLDMEAVEGGKEFLSCAPFGGSSAGGTKRYCC